MSAVINWKVHCIYIDDNNFSDNGANRMYNLLSQSFKLDNAHCELQFLSMRRNDIAYKTAKKVAQSFQTFMQQKCLYLSLDHAAVVQETSNRDNDELSFLNDHEFQIFNGVNCNLNVLPYIYHHCVHLKKSCHLQQCRIKYLSQRCTQVIYDLNNQAAVIVALQQRLLGNKVSTALLCKVFKQVKTIKTVN